MATWNCILRLNFDTEAKTMQQQLLGFYLIKKDGFN